MRDYGVRNHARHGRAVTQRQLPAVCHFFLKRSGHGDVAGGGADFSLHTKHIAPAPAPCAERFSVNNVASRLTACCGRVRVGRCRVRAGRRRVRVGRTGRLGTALDRREEQRHGRQDEEQRHLGHVPEIVNNWKQIQSSWKLINTCRRITLRRDLVCFEE